MKNKGLIIAVVLIVAAIVAYFLYQKGTNKNALDTTNPTDAFGVDDQAAYKAARAILPNTDKAWVDKYVAENYAENREMDKIGGRTSKTMAFINTVGAVIYNKDGKFKADNGDPWLWSKEDWAKIWNFQVNLKSKYGGL